MCNKSIAVVVSSPMTVNSFLINHICELSKCYNVSVIANFGGFSGNLNLPEEVKLYNVAIVRKISLISDLKALFHLIKLFHRERFSAIYSVTPKAGLISMLAGKFVGSKIRIHTFTGQVWANKTGIYRNLLKSFDKVIARCTTVSLIDSHSQRDFLLNEGVVSILGSKVLGSGSISGVDTNRFIPSLTSRERVLNELNIPLHAKVILFIGRLNKDKGISELIEAFKVAYKSSSNLYLLVVGPDEENMKGGLLSSLGLLSKNVVFVPFTINPEELMQVSDVLCLPSHREGFGTVVIEAAACGIPCVGSNIYGLSDAIVDDLTGVLVPVNDFYSLAQSLHVIINDDKKRVLMGNAARKRAVDKFDNTILSEALAKVFNDEFRDLEI
ncbi:glycosyltransferase [Shewanella psychrophila]|uniref:Glycosyltransferase n=1 Tax=Shewanella psychrophila TaxID=225848 RepID=A0A1S6HTH7_9GAMM|nr:glycosyltransferase [Shewanella psychrophila]AQS38835.1 glycosyltransferase [Shewanella psychrophila]